jgi:hypothetical protein
MCATWPKRALTADESRVSCRSSPHLRFRLISDTLDRPELALAKDDKQQRGLAVLLLDEPRARLGTAEGPTAALLPRVRSARAGGTDRVQPEGC